MLYHNWLLLRWDVFLWWLVPSVILTEPRITWKTGVWTCLWQMILIALIEVGRFTHCGWHRSPARVLGCINGEREMTTAQTHHSVSWLWMWGDHLLPASAVWLPYHDRQYNFYLSQKNLSPLCCFHLDFFFNLSNKKRNEGITLYI